MIKSAVFPLLITSVAKSLVKTNSAAIALDSSADTAATLKEASVDTAATLSEVIKSAVFPLLITSVDKSAVNTASAAIALDSSASTSAILLATSVDTAAVL